MSRLTSIRYNGTHVNQRFFDVLHGFPGTGALINDYPANVDEVTGRHLFEEGDIVKLVPGPQGKASLDLAGENEEARCGVVINDGYDYDGEFTGRLVVAHSGVRVITDNVDTETLEWDDAGTPTPATPNFLPGKGVYANNGKYQLEQLDGATPPAVVNTGRRIGELESWDATTGRAVILQG